eukprot:TRINITY_DN18443_c0_g1_i2.p2 TRINITY_DN18443_c0_g1~~TRINITY_DN18443_c0_g1_i2.p2  ORF type:complete len:104 (-),score=23.14 TRINITY_DN18443_c0_g1_i2:47-358(-)
MCIRDRYMGSKLGTKSKDLQRSKASSCSLFKEAGASLFLVLLKSSFMFHYLSLIHISEPTRPLYISYAVFCLKKKKKTSNKKRFHICKKNKNSENLTRHVVAK